MAQILTTFNRQSGNPNAALHGSDAWGCPDCGEETFTVQESFTARVHGTRAVTCSWYGEHGDYETDDYDGEEIHDQDDEDGGEWTDGELECVSCGTTYSYCSAEEAFNDAQEYDEDDDDDEDAERTNWPFLDSNGVPQADAVGALLQQHVPHCEDFTWEERLGKTVIGVQPKARSGHYRGGDHHAVEACTQCKGDMSTQYIRVARLPQKQTRYAESTQELYSVRSEAPIELHIPICYVCHTAA